MRRVDDRWSGSWNGLSVSCQRVKSCWHVAVVGPLAHGLNVLFKITSTWPGAFGVIAQSS